MLSKSIGVVEAGAVRTLQIGSNWYGNLKMTQSDKKYSHKKVSTFKYRICQHILKQVVQLGKLPYLGWLFFRSVEL